MWLHVMRFQFGGTYDLQLGVEMYAKYNETGNKEAGPLRITRRHNPEDTTHYQRSENLRSAQIQRVTFYSSI
jgi:hypothetical protein